MHWEKVSPVHPEGKLSRDAQVAVVALLSCRKKALGLNPCMFSGLVVSGCFSFHLQLVYVILFICSCYCCDRLSPCLFIENILEIYAWAHCLVILCLYIHFIPAKLFKYESPVFSSNSICVVYARYWPKAQHTHTSAKPPFSLCGKWQWVSTLLFFKHVNIQDSDFETITYRTWCQPIK